MLESLVNRFIYYPEHQWWATPSDLGLEAEEVRLAPEPGVKLHAWFFPRPEPLATLLFCHGNAGNASHRLENVYYLVEAGFQVLLFDYRGYGHSSGQPSEAGLYRDAEAAWAHLVERGDTEAAPRIIFGRSLGRGCGRRFGDPRRHRRRPHCGEYLHFHPDPGPPRFSLPLPELPVKYDSLSKIGSLRMPLLAIHGQEDELIPFADGRALFEAASEPKDWYPIPGAGHNDTVIVGGEAYFRQLAAFASELREQANKLGITSWEWKLYLITSDYKSSG